MNIPDMSMDKEKTVSIEKNFRITQRKTLYRVEEKLGNRWKQVGSVVFGNEVAAERFLQEEIKKAEENEGWKPVKKVEPKKAV
jgi:hypothetical protein